MPELYVCYLPADSKVLANSVLNKLATWWVGAPVDGRTQPMIHCELFFPSAARSSTLAAFDGKSCGIHYNGVAFFNDKRFSRDTWTFRALHVTDAQYAQTRAFCQRVADERHTFNKRGYFCGLAKPDKQWYCSQLVGTALRECGVVDLTDQQISHPEHLYTALMQHTYLDTVRDINNVTF